MGSLPAMTLYHCCPPHKTEQQICMLYTKQVVQATRSRRPRRQSTARLTSLRRLTHSLPRGHPLRHAATASPATPRRAPPSMPKSTLSCTTTPSARPQRSGTAPPTPTPKPSPTPAQGPSTRATRSTAKHSSTYGLLLLAAHAYVIHSYTCIRRGCCQESGWTHHSKTAILALMSLARNGRCSKPCLGRG